MPVAKLKIRGIQPYDWANLAILIFSLNFNREDNRRVAFKSYLGYAAEGEAILKIVLIYFDTINLVAHASSVFLYPVFLEIGSVDLALACHQIANQCYQPWRKARLRKDVHFNLLNDNHLVVQRAQV